MKIFFSQADASPEIIEEDFSPIDLKESIRKTRQALEIAYAGFDNALESDLIDSSQSWPLCSRRIRKKIYTNIPRFVPWSAMFSVNWFLP